MASTRWKEIAESVRSAVEAGQLRPGDRLPSETELAARWGVCRMTAHRAMQELDRQGVVTRRRRRGTVVSGPKAPLTGFASLLFGHAHLFPQVAYIRGIRAGLPDRYHLLHCDSQEDPLREADYLRRLGQEADGIFCYPTCAPENVPLMQCLAEAGTPIVCVDRVPDGLAVDAVVTDNYGSSLEALRSLVRRGHRRIAHFTGRGLRISSVRERYEAYRQAMAEAGEPDCDRWVRMYSDVQVRGLGQRVRQVREALSEMLAGPEPPTAIFCLSDHYVAATLEACDQLGVEVPDRLEVLGFCDYPALSPRLARSVHRIVQQTDEIGRLAAERLRKRLEGEAGPAEALRVPARFFEASRHNDQSTNGEQR